jgi:hypothetical protein
MTGTTATMERSVAPNAGREILCGGGQASATSHSFGYSEGSITTATTTMGAPRVSTRF